MWIDPSGLEIVLSSDATEEQRRAFERAIAYLNQSETFRELWNILQYGGETITIAFTNNLRGTGYAPEIRTVIWHPTGGLILYDGISVQSAALGLAHEMGHAAQHILGISYYMESLAWPGNTLLLRRMEEDNMARFEIPIARELGEPIRMNYRTSMGVWNMANSTDWGILHTRPRWHYLSPLVWRQPRITFENRNEMRFIS